MAKTLDFELNFDDDFMSTKLKWESGKEDLRSGPSG